jgi:LytS/YehU family sensor histidine kinase
MDMAARLELNLGILVHAAETAYVENAPATYELLSKANDLIRYLQPRDDAVSLEDELYATEQYAFVQRKRHGARFEVTLHWPDAGTGAPVTHLSLIGFVHELFCHYVESREESVAFSVRFRPENDTICQILASSEAGEYYHERSL